jgi:hypothetical protein
MTNFSVVVGLQVAAAVGGAALWGSNGYALIGSRKMDAASPDWWIHLAKRAASGGQSLTSLVLADLIANPAPRLGTP